MIPSRRSVLGGLLGVAAGACARTSEKSIVAPTQPKGQAVLVFDGLALFDPRPVLSKMRAAGGDRGEDLKESFRRTLFEYQWLRALAGQYRDFRQLSADALVHACVQLEVPLSRECQQGILSGLDALSAWPDVESFMDQVRSKGYRVCVLSNMTPRMLKGAVSRSGLTSKIDYLLSTDSAKTFKPHPAAYRIVEDAIEGGRSDVTFVAFAGWDAAGASWYGFRTYWLNRMGAAAEVLHAPIWGTGSSMDALLRFLEVQYG